MRQLTRFLVAAGLALAWSAPASAVTTVDLSFNEEAVQGIFSQSFRDGWAEWQIGGIHHEDDGDAVAAGLHATGPVGDSPGVRGARLGIGGKVVYFTRGGQHGWALALGGHFTYPLPANDRIYFRIHAHYAPGVLTAGDGEDYREGGAEVGFRVIPRVDVYGGVRGVRGRFEDPEDARPDTGAHIGLRIRF